MKLKNWTPSHSKGLLVGVLSPIVFIPITIFVLALINSYDFSFLWDKFLANQNYRSLVISISVISNLVWFYISLNRENYGFARGVIFGTFCFLPYIIYVKFIV